MSPHFANKASVRKRPASRALNIQGCLLRCALVVRTQGRCRSSSRSTLQVRCLVLLMQRRAARFRCCFLVVFEVRQVRLGFLRADCWLAFVRLRTTATTLSHCCACERECERTNHCNLRELLHVPNLPGVLNQLLHRIVVRNVKNFNGFRIFLAKIGLGQFHDFVATAIQNRAQHVEAESLGLRQFHFWRHRELVF